MKFKKSEIKKGDIYTFSITFSDDSKESIVHVGRTWGEVFEYCKFDTNEQLTDKQLDTWSESIVNELIDDYGSKIFEKKVRYDYNGNDAIHSFLKNKY